MSIKLPTKPAMTDAELETTATPELIDEVQRLRSALDALVRTVHKYSPESCIDSQAYADAETIVGYVRTPYSTAQDLAIRRL